MVTCGADMAAFADGDFPEDIAALAVQDVKAFEGTWEDLKDISESIDTILEKSGVGFIKRKATSVATLKKEFKILKTDGSGSPEVWSKTIYPLGITKEITLMYDNSVSDFKDPDTCDWKIQGVLCNGRLIQKRIGKNGVMYDSRCVLNAHPEDKTKESPVMCFLWTIVDATGKKHQAKCWLKKVA